MDIFQALADPTRRKIIEQLSQYEAAKFGLSIKDITQDLSITRQAVTKHLNILINCGAVDAQFVGKEKRHFLQQNKLREAQEWLQPIAKQWDNRLAKLNKHLKGKMQRKKSHD